MPDPLDEYFEHKHKLAEDRDTHDLLAWQQWKNDPSRQNFTDLRGRFKSEVDKRVHMWTGGAKKIDPSSMRLNLQKHMVNAFETYSPEIKGTTGQSASLRTHVDRALKRSQRFMSTHQNMAKIPEAKIGLIQPVQRARDELYDQFGRDPTHVEISDFLNDNQDLIGSTKMRGTITPKLVANVENYQIRDVPGAAFETDPISRVGNYDAQLVSSIRSVLSSGEQEVYDHMFGLNGKPKIDKQKDLAKRLGKSDTYVSRVRTRINDKFNKFR